MIYSPSILGSFPNWIVLPLSLHMSSSCVKESGYGMQHYLQCKNWLLFLLIRTEEDAFVMTLRLCVCSRYPFISSDGAPDSSHIAILSHCQACVCINEQGASERNELLVISCAHWHTSWKMMMVLIQRLDNVLTYCHEHVLSQSA